MLNLLARITNTALDLAVGLRPTVKDVWRSPEERAIALWLNRLQEPSWYLFRGQHERLDVKGQKTVAAFEAWFKERTELREKLESLEETLKIEAGRLKRTVEDLLREQQSKMPEGIKKCSFYSVIRYEPSKLAEEFINVGVLTFNSEKICARFLQKWDRANAFAGNDSPKRMTDGYRQSVLPSLTEAKIREVAGRPDAYATFRLTPLRGSLSDPETLMNQIAPTFLIERGSTLSQHF